MFGLIQPHRLITDSENALLFSNAKPDSYPIPNPQLLTPEEDMWQRKIVQ